MRYANMLMVCAALVCLTPLLTSDTLAEGKRSETARSMSESLEVKKDVIQPGGFGGPDNDDWTSGTFAYIAGGIHHAITAKLEQFVNVYREIIQSSHVPLFLIYCSLKIAI